MVGQKVQTPDAETINGRGGAEIRNPDANRKMVAPKVQQTHGLPRCSGRRGKTADGHKMHRGPVWEDSVDDSADSLLG